MVALQLVAETSPAIPAGPPDLRFPDRDSETAFTRLQH
jgi:hypothetical protein